MAKKSNWNDDYWLYVMQLYMSKPTGVKPLYSKAAVDLGMEIHVHPWEIRARQQQIEAISTPRIERIWDEYADNPRKLSRAVRLLRGMKGFGSADEFYEGVEVTESFERDFRHIGSTGVTPVVLILVLDLYFRLTPLTMVAETPEVVELSQLMRIEPSKTAEVLGVFQYCDPYLNRQDVIFSQLLGPCEEIWSRYAQWTPVQLAEYADKLKDYFKS